MLSENQNKRFVAIDELASYLGLSKNKIYHLVSDRRIPFIHLDGKKTLRFDLRAIDVWMEKQTIKPAPRAIEN